MPDTTAFRDRLRQIHNHGALALGISLGHRLGLFDVMSGLPPSTGAQVAAAAGLDERYVLEWLSAMTVGGVVDWEGDPDGDGDLDGDGGTFVLPPDRAALLTRRSSPDNMAVTLQFVPLLASVESALVERFRDGDGLGYGHYGRFHDIMAEMSSQTVVSALFDRVLPLVPGLAERLQSGMDVLDVGCGRGRAMVALASAFPNSRFVGMDIAPEAVTSARARSEALGLRNVRFERRDAARMPDTPGFDLVTAFDAIHDQAEPREVLRRIRGAVRQGGVFLMQEIAASSHLGANRDHPLGPFLYTLSFAHCVSVALARGGAALGACWGRERATAMLTEVGFRGVARHRLPHDPMNEYYVAVP